MNQIIDS